MKVYSPADIAMVLQIKPATLRKYSGILEKHGYNIERNSQGHRYYRDKDIMTLRNIISGRNSGATLEESIYNVVKLEGSSTALNDTNSDDAPNNSDISELKEMVHNQNAMIHKQNELIEGLSKRLDQQQNYIDQSIRKRDQELMETMQESLEAKKQLVASAEKEPEKRGFFSRLFKKSGDNE